MGDDGLLDMVVGLNDALQSTTSGHEVMLQELNLANTGISIRSLEALATVIELSANHIKDLDLSDNLISVNTVEDQRAWETFLQSFRRCNVMRRLVLSRNDLSNPTAFEIFARVYSQHPSVDGKHMQSAKSSSNGDDHLSRTSSDYANQTSGIRMHYADNQPCGLRSIPYIVLQDVKMVHLGALWLSFPLEVHPKPDSLMPTLKPGPMIAVLQEYQRTGCEGIIYRPNAKISVNGWRLLDGAEVTRRQIEAMDHSQYLTSSESDNSR